MLIKGYGKFAHYCYGHNITQRFKSWTFEAIQFVVSAGHMASNKSIYRTAEVCLETFWELVQMLSESQVKFYLMIFLKMKLKVNNSNNQFLKPGKIEQFPALI